MAKPFFGRLPIEPAGDHQYSPILFPHKLHHPYRARIGIPVRFQIAGCRIYKVQVSEPIVIELLGNRCKSCFWVIVADVVEAAERGQPHSDAFRSPDGADGLNDLQEKSGAIFRGAAILIGALVGS